MVIRGRGEDFLVGGDGRPCPQSGAEYIGVSSFQVACFSVGFSSSTAIDVVDYVLLVFLMMAEPSVYNPCIVAHQRSLPLFIFFLPTAHLDANLASTLSLSCSFLSLSSSFVVSNLALA